MKKFNTFLTLDTSSKKWSVSLFHQGTEKETIVCGVEISLSANLLQIINQLLSENKIKKNEIECLGIVSGPGSFTGLRVGLAVVKSLSKSLKIPWFGFNLLQIIEGVDNSVNKVCFVITNDSQIAYNEFSGVESETSKVELVSKSDFFDKFGSRRNLKMITTSETFKKLDNEFLVNKIQNEILEVSETEISILIGSKLGTSDISELSSNVSIGLIY